MPEAIRLFRFLSATAAIRTIEKKAFRVGRIAEFNDPFEWRVGFKNYVPEAERFVRSAQEEALRYLNSQFGIICFCDTLEDPVLWSHYADHHRGIVLEVDHWKNEQLHPVTYTDERPTIDVALLGGSERDAHLLAELKKMLARKSPGWSYEREYRVFAGLASCVVADGSYFLPIPTDFLKRVILGFKCLIDDVYLRRCLDLAGFPEVEVARAFDDNRTYKIGANHALEPTRGAVTPRAP
jgi:hypothetical protein